MLLQTAMQKRWTKLRKVNLTSRQVLINSCILKTVNHVNTVVNLMNTRKKSVQHIVNSVAYATKWIILKPCVKAFQRNRLVQSLQRSLFIKLLHLIGQTVMRTIQFGLWKKITRTTSTLLQPWCKGPEAAENSRSSTHCTTWWLRTDQRMEERNCNQSSSQSLLWDPVWWGKLPQKQTSSEVYTKKATGAIGTRRHSPWEEFTESSVMKDKTSTKTVTDMKLTMESSDESVTSKAPQPITRSGREVKEPIRFKDYVKWQFSFNFCVFIVYVWWVV